MNKLYKFLQYITNNDSKPKHEKEFDMAFFIIITVAILIGSYLLVIKSMAEWIAFLVIEYVWSLDGMRHNRS
jgi:hypothetical protein